MTTLTAPPTLGGLYALPLGNVGWLAGLLGKHGATRADLFIALNEASAKITSQPDADQAIAEALASALGQPTASWHHGTHPLRTPETARAACAALIATGYKP